MESNANFGDRAEAQVTRHPRIHSGLAIGGVFNLECWGPSAGDRVLNRFLPRKYHRRSVLKWAEPFSNIWTDEGLDSLLDVYFHAATQITTWYCVLFENDFTPDGDETYAVPGYTECTAYDEANRPEYVEAASSSQSVTNSANKAQFTMNATKTIYGGALVGGGTDANTKGDAAGGGTLACAGRFSSSKAVEDDDIINLTYTASAADDAV